MMFQVKYSIKKKEREKTYLEESQIKKRNNLIQSMRFSLLPVLREENYLQFLSKLEVVKPHLVGINI